MACVIGIAAGYGFDAWRRAQPAATFSCMVLAKEDDPMNFTSSAGVMRHRFLWLGMLLVMLSALGLALPAAADGVVNASSFTGTAIEGVDPVAYFIEGKPVEGKSEFAHDWMDATWYFASAENRDLFAADPEKYAPQYGGYCAWAVANGYTAKIDPEAWKIVDDKLYLNYSKDVQAQWAQDVPGNITKGDANWPKIRADLAG
jgi:YHS domain-containing protein